MASSSKSRLMGDLFFALIVSGVIAVVMTVGWIVVTWGNWAASHSSLMPPDWKTSARDWFAGWFFVPFALLAFRWFFKEGQAQRRAEAQEREQRKAEAAARADEERKEAERRAYEVDRQKRRLEELPGQMTATYRAAIAQLDDASSRAHRAREQLSSSMYSPFWESVEAGATALARHDETVQRLVDLARQQTQLADALGVREASASTEMAALPNSHVGESVMADLRQLADKAQTDFHFASIYEQRRTTAAVVSGFRSLGDALEQLGGRIEAGYTSLQQAIAAQTEASEAGRLTDQRRGSILNESVEGLMPGSFGAEIYAMNKHLSELARHR